MHSVVVIGSGGNALDVMDVVDALNLAGRDWEVRGFLDDARAAGTTHVGLPVLGRIEDAGRYNDASFINAIGSDKTFRLRPAIVARTGLSRERFATLVHPTASVSKRALLGQGTCVNHGVSIGGGAVVGDHVYLGVGCIIGHDAVIEDYAVIAPGAIISGFTRIGQGSYIGAGAIIKQTKQVGAGAIVGMGAVVCKSVPAGAIWVGNPAGPHEPSRRGKPTGFEAVEMKG
jgi:sugar O-acyltransferase (sialic acid O-acetyltransferase NeuD family)